MAGKRREVDGVSSTLWVTGQALYLGQRLNRVQIKFVGKIDILEYARCRAACNLS